jgi:TonB family protein
MRQTSRRNAETGAASPGGAAADSGAPLDGQGRTRRRGLGFWVAIALLVHAELLLIGGVASYLFAPRDVELAKGLGADGAPIDVAAVDDDTAREILAELDRQEEQKKTEEAKKEEESLRAPGQVVDLPAPREEKRPDSAKFVSEHDATVEHEVKKYGRFDDKAHQGEQQGKEATSKPQSQAGDGRLAMRTPDLGKFLRGHPAPPAAPGRPGRAGSAYGAADPGQPAEGGAIPELGSDGRPQPGGGARGGTGPSLMPNEQQLARAVGSGGTQDALKDVDDGEETALNSKRWRFASFFNRVKRQVAEHWHPDEAYRQRDPTGAIYGRTNRYTELRIQLTPDGRLGNVALALPSGLEFLDDAAIEAFKEAEPFPNPPRQLIEANGHINFGFGFMFDLNGPPQMRWFRYNN